MKPLFHTPILLALATALVSSGAMSSQAQEQPMPPPATDNNLPPNIVAGSPEAEVVKLLRAGMDVTVIKTYIANSANPFNLDAEKILALTDLGVPTDLINAMMDHDRGQAATAPAPVNTATITTAAPATVETAPPTAPVTVTYFQETLSPYGAWVEIDGYGRCWRPTVAVYDSGWQPYRERGHWVYSDCGWYWDSEYSWGVTFHYGRWFQHPRFGWCWWPDTVWAPSWVTWRSNDDYCGWAPLPPFTVYRPDGGFFYRGVSVSIGFDFGLSAGCFTFISPSHFCAPHPRYYCLDSRRSLEVYHHTTIINNYSIHRGGGHRDVVINNGIPIDRINRFNRRPIEPVRVGEIRNAQRQGWRDNDHPGNDRPGNGHPSNDRPAGHNLGGGNPQHHDAVTPGDRSRDSRSNNNDNRSRPGSSQPAPNGPQNNQHNNQPDRGQPDRNRSGQAFTRDNNPGATASSFNQGDRNKPAPSTQIISPQAPANNQGGSQSWPGQRQFRDRTDNRNGQSGFTAAPRTTIPAPNSSGATAGTFNQAERNRQNRAAGNNNSRPTVSANNPTATAPGRITPPATQIRPSQPSAQPSSPAQNRNNDRVTSAPVQRSQPATEQRSARVETPRQSSAPQASQTAPRIQPPAAAPAQPRSADSSARNSDRVKRDR